MTRLFSSTSNGELSTDLLQDVRSVHIKPTPPVHNVLSPILTFCLRYYVTSKKHWYHLTCWKALLICLQKEHSNSQNFDKNNMNAPLNLFLLSSNVKFEYIYLKAHSTIGLYDISTEIIECSSEKCKNYIECYFINCLLKIRIYPTFLGKKVFNNLTDSNNYDW